MDVIINILIIIKRRVVTGIQKPSWKNMFFQTENPNNKL